MVENILAANPLPSPLNLGVKRSKLNFYRILSYQIKKILEFRNMAANILPTYLPPTPLDLGCGVKSQNSTYWEHGYVAYEIK